MAYKMLKNEKGEYAIRKGYWFSNYYFVDVCDAHTWWSMEEYVNRYCWTPSKERILKIWVHLNERNNSKIINPNQLIEELKNETVKLGWKNENYK